MPVILSYEVFRNGAFTAAQQKLRAYPFKNQRTSFNVARLLGMLDKESELCQAAWHKLVDQYAKKDEHGKIVPHEGREGTYSIREDAADEWKAKVEEFHKVSFTVERNPFKLTELEELRLTPGEILALGPLLEEPTDETPKTLAAVPPPG